MAAGAGAAGIWRRNVSVLTRATPRSVLIETGSGQSAVLRLEGAAVIVWESLAKPATDDQLVRIVSDRLATEPTALRSHVLDARRLLAEHDAIVVTHE